MYLNRVMRVAVRGEPPSMVRNKVETEGVPVFPNKLFCRPECQGRLAALSSDSFDEEPTKLILASGVIEGARRDLAIAARWEYGMLGQRLAFVLLDEDAGGPLAVVRAEKIEIQQIIRLGSGAVYFPAGTGPVEPPPQPVFAPRPVANKRARAHAMIEACPDTGMTAHQVYGLMKLDPGNWETLLGQKVERARSLAASTSLPVALTWLYVLNYEDGSPPLNEVVAAAERTARKFVSLFGYDPDRTRSQAITKAVELGLANPVSLEYRIGRSLSLRGRELAATGSDAGPQASADRHVGPPFLEAAPGKGSIPGGEGQSG